jgi:hypothetical protein
MKFIIERKVLIRMIEQSRGGLRSKRERQFGLKLSACAARVFVSGQVTTAGYEALVFSEGECYVTSKSFLAVLRTYAEKSNLTIEVDASGLKIDRFTMPVGCFSAKTSPPGQFQVFPVTDLRVLGTQPPSSVV